MLYLLVILFATLSWCLCFKSHSDIGILYFALGIVFTMWVALHPMIISDVRKNMLSDACSEERLDFIEYRISELKSGLDSKKASESDTVYYWKEIEDYHDARSGCFDKAKGYYNSVTGLFGMISMWGLTPSDIPQHLMDHIDAQRRSEEYHVDR